jgi:hypothetical protein
VKGPASNPKVISQVEEFLGEEVADAFAAYRSLRGRYLLLALGVVAFLWFTGTPGSWWESALGGGVAGGLLALLGIVSRQPFVAAATADEVVLCRAARLHPTRPVRIVARAPRSGAVVLEERGEGLAVVGERVTTRGIDRDIAYRVARS